MTIEQGKKSIPTEINATHELVSALKDGMRGQTLLLRRKSDGEPAVLKCCAEEYAQGQGVIEALKGIGGNGVPKIIKTISYKGHLYILREYVEGKTLLEILREQGPFSATEAAKACVQICEVLQRLHGFSSPLIHRDIKAENVVLTPAGECVLIDFGIARIYNDHNLRDTTIMGTGFAAAPEQFGYAQTDPRSDIYSVGVLLHELTTGEYALDKGKVPAELRHIVAKCTRFDPKDRFQSASSLKNALLRAKRSKRPRLATAAALSLIILLAVSIFINSEPQPASRYAFSSPRIAQEVARQLNKDEASVTYSDLEQITSIKLIGEMAIDDWSRVDIHGSEITLDAKTYEGMEQGTVDTLEDIPNLPNLSELVLCNQEISDLTPLTGCNLTKLALHGNAISNLEPLGTCTELQEIYISNNPIADLTPLTELSQLWRLNIGATNITDLAALKGMQNLTYLELHDCLGLSGLDDLGDLGGLKYLSVRPVTSSDLRVIAGLTELEGLYIWSGEPVGDLSALSDLTSLHILFADITFLSSLDGIEGMEALSRLDVRSTYLLSAAPLAGLTTLVDVNFTCMHSDSEWSEVSGMLNLRYATIRPADETAFRTALGERNVEIYLSSD